MASPGSIIVETCDEKMAKLSRKPVEMEGLLYFFSSFPSGFSSIFRFNRYYFLCFLLHGDGDPAKPQ